ncbi:MAG: hypothetical protein ACOYXB_09835 [Bacteroidota bacterium]
MKTIIRFGAGLAVVFALLLTTSCEKENNGLSPESGLKALVVNPVFVDELPADVCVTKSFDLIAGQSINVGKVVVANNATNVYVKYVAAEGYLISETHLFLGDVAELPVNKKGNPVIGHFPYSYSGEGLATVIHEIPIGELNADGGYLDIFAHAVVISEDGTFNETAWGKSGEKEGSVIFALKSYFQSFGTTTGTLFAQGCDWGAYFGYNEIDLASFTSETYSIVSPYGGYPIGSVYVELVDDQLTFTAKALYSNIINKSYLFVGSKDELNTYLSSSCPDYLSFPYQDLETSSYHFFSVPIGDYLSTGGEGGIYDATRWTYFIENYKLCQ